MWNVFDKREPAEAKRIESPTPGGSAAPELQRAFLAPTKKGVQDAGYVATGLGSSICFYRWLFVGRL